MKKLYKPLIPIRCSYVYHSRAYQHPTNIARILEDIKEWCSDAKPDEIKISYDRYEECIAVEICRPESDEEFAVKMKKYEDDLTFYIKESQRLEDEKVAKAAKKAEILASLTQEQRDILGI